MPDASPETCTEPFLGDRWTAHGGDAFRVRAWEDLGVVYDPASGQTHMLGRLACDALRLLQESHATSAFNLAQGLARMHGIDNDAEMLSATRRILGLLLELGLVAHRDE